MSEQPNISEAARRAAEELHNPASPVAIAKNTAIIERAIQTAIDSTHPAPKEGETPETDAVAQRCSMWPLNYDGMTIWEHARSLELRLAEAKRDARIAKRLGEAAFEKMDALRSQLQKANELLSEAHGLIPRYDEYAEVSNRIHTHLNQQSK